MKTVANNMLQASATAATSTNQATEENEVDREASSVPSHPSTQMRQTKIRNLSEIS